MIEARSLTKRYPSGILALDDVSFRVEAASIYCLLGSLGSGKTTTINLFWAAERPTSGNAIVAGEDATNCAMAARSAAAIVTSDGAFYGSMTARSNVTFFARMANVRARETDVVQAMRQMGIRDDDFDCPVARLGKEARVLLFLSVAVARGTPAVLLDDPTAGLSPRGSLAVQEALLLLRDMGRAVLLATSDVALTAAVADHIGLLKAGRKVMERTKAEALGQGLTQFYLEYTGRPPSDPWPDRGSALAP